MFDVNSFICCKLPYALTLFAIPIATNVSCIHIPEPVC